MADEQQPQAEDISDELARKYDPERLLKILQKRAGRGETLEHSVRGKYEQKFGVDLGHVRIITGEFAQEFNKRHNSYAVTIGNTGMILMGNSPEKSMGSASGQALLAHELTHVAQAKGGLHRKSYGGDMPFGGEHHEIEAEAEHHEAAELHSSTGQAATESQNQMASAEQMKEDIEKIKQRVMDMAADAARTQQWRNGTSRRP
jgi:hypothetical protein